MGITLQGDAYGIEALGSTFDADGIVLDGVQKAGIEVGPGANATIHHVLIRNTRP